MSPEQVEDIYDAVIIGAGAAGLSAALGILRTEKIKEMSAEGRRPKLLVISKLQALRSHTGSAEGGIAASLGNVEHDDWHWHYYDTVKGGDWLVDQDAAKILAQYAPQTVVNLERSGVAFSRTADGHIAQRKFGGHTKDYGKAPVRRAAYAADRIGHQILYALWQQCIGAGVQFAEEWYVTDLVLDDRRDRACGVVAFDTHTGKTHAIASRNILMATGGAGRLFHTTSNSWDLTGDGMALALKAGLQLEDCEFVQFHPTGLAHTGILLSEASRGEGGILRNADGEAFMARYAPEHKDLAARDVVSRSIMAEVDAGRGVADPKEPNGPKDCVWLDMTGIDKAHMLEVLPQVVETIRDYAGLDPSKDWVPVKPTAHYTMGGIPITTDGEVYRWQDGNRQIVRGLYAAGECSCVSVHGANRLGGNSLLDACLFGTRAGESIARRIAGEQNDAAADEQSSDAQNQNTVRLTTDKRNASIKTLMASSIDDDADAENADADSHSEAISSGETASASAQPTSGETDSSPEKDTADSTPDTGRDNPYQLLADLGTTMEHALAVRCDADSIAKAQQTINEKLLPRATSLHTHSRATAFNQELTAIWEVRNLIELAQAMLNASVERRESRGAFARTDFPKRDDEHFLTHSMAAADGTVSWQPVHIVDMPPKSRAY
ncbi:FAD-binding protein [Bifidobacterium sp. ESL0798]|uniref:FAD-binding protein n=1 Tax=Bifidobacterium sp. ESL0798 TaxID=2983235 RepID=UPI0023F7F0E7|nr:FAD-binding protein [Bifidobacterium sp. ESL0798]WEV74559.1 FAD-binding protein [Bifidobacterium sp. ESL0798]